MEHIKSENILIKTPETEEELSGLYNLNKTVHGDLVENLARKMIERHPDISAENFLIVKDAEKDIVAATLAMVPWRIEYFGTKLKVLEMAIVATDEKYRKFGFQRKLAEHFNTHFTKNNYDLSIIQGIPGFYSNFGYHYGVPLENHIILDLYNIDDLKKGTHSITMAGQKDCDEIEKFHSGHRKIYDITSLNRADHYRYIIDGELNSETDSELYLVKKSNAAIGYCKIAKHGFSEGLIISEVSDMEYDAYCSLLTYLKEIALKRNKPFIKVMLPEFHNLSQIAYSLGGHLHWNYRWQIKLNNLQFFETITPILEERIKKSMFENLTCKLPISLYNSGISFTFENGKITAIEDYWAQQEECALRKESFTKLVFGCCDITELESSSNEIFMTSKNRLLMNILFPKGSAYLYIPY